MKMIEDYKDLSDIIDIEQAVEWIDTDEHGCLTFVYANKRYWRIMHRSYPNNLPVEYIVFRKVRYIVDVEY